MFAIQLALGWQFLVVEIRAELQDCQQEPLIVHLKEAIIGGGKSKGDAVSLRIILDLCEIDMNYKHTDPSCC